MADAGLLEALLDLQTDSGDEILTSWTLEYVFLITMVNTPLESWNTHREVLPCVEVVTNEKFRRYMQWQRRIEQDARSRAVGHDSKYQDFPKSLRLLFKE